MNTNHRTQKVISAFSFVVLTFTSRTLTVKYSAGDVFAVEMGGVAAPQDGDELLLKTQGESLEPEDIEADLGKIRVVPNPYFVTNRAVTSEGTDKVFFTHLPPRCTIRIYTLVGELVSVKSNTKVQHSF